MGRVAVVGGGIQGSLIALQASIAGHEVVLIDASQTLVGRASLWNEGKLHLGYIYAADRSLRTAEMMVRGSFGFVDRLENSTGARIPDSAISRPFTYLVDRQSLLDMDDLEAHYHACDRLIRTHHDQSKWSYPGYSGGATFRQLSRGEIAELAGDWCAAAFETIEVSIDPHVVAGHLRGAIEDSTVKTVLGVRVDSIEPHQGYWTLSCDGQSLGRFDRVVNAAWEDRLRLDERMGLRPGRPVCHRYKVAIHHTGPAAHSLPSVSIVLGPYGDVVSFGDRAYLSWYPVGRIGTSTEVCPPDFEAALTEERRSQILAGTVDALQKRLPSIAAARGALQDRSAAAIEGGYVVAWGDADIDDRTTELHERFDIGLSGTSTYHSVDTGKYCTAAEIADRVVTAMGAG